MDDHSQLRQLWSVVRSILGGESFSFSTIKLIIGLSGADLTALAHLEQFSGRKSATKSQLLSGVDTQVLSMDEPVLRRFICTVCERMLDEKPEIETSLLEFFRKLGWTFHQGQIVEVQVFDPSELPQLPPESHVDLLKAAARLRDGDLSGAISSACAAVESVTSSVYHARNLGNPNSASFQERVSSAFRELGVVAEIERQLVELGWQQPEAKQVAENVKGSLNHAANAMQSLRSKMGDVHGTKPILKPLAFDSIKWATLIVRLLN
jgi:hypothetical protein